MSFLVGLWRSVKLWMGVVLPPRWTIWLVLALFLAMILVPGLVFVVRQGHWPIASERAMFLRGWFYTFVPAVGISYGLFRCAAFHPLRDGYRQWLELTPWTPDKRLPFGPAWLVPQDVIAFIPLLAINWYAVGETMWLWYAIAVTCGYLTAALFCLWRCEVYLSFYTIAFLLVATVYGLVRLDLTVVLSTLAASYVVAMLGLHRSLRGFPWRRFEYAWIRHVLADPGTVTPTWWVWPWERLAPVPTPVGMAWREAIVVPCLLASLCWVLMSSAPPDERERFTGLASSLGLIFVSFRLFFYLRNYRSPISVAGRIATGRLIIPRFDIVFVAPLASLLLANALPLLLMHAGVDPAIACAATVAVGLQILFGVGPPLATWQLTGGHRIVPTGGRRPVAKL